MLGLLLMVTGIIWACKDIVTHPVFVKGTISQATYGGYDSDDIDRSGTDYYYVRVTYTYKGQTYRNVDVGRKDGDGKKWAVGKQITVRVNPKNPEDFTIDGIGFMVFMILLLLGLLVLFIIFMPFLIFEMRTEEDIAKMKENAKVVYAVITNISNYKDSDTDRERWTFELKGKDPESGKEKMFKHMAESYEQVENYPVDTPIKVYVNRRFKWDYIVDIR